jgi:hypothetical protein
LRRTPEDRKGKILWRRFGPWDEGSRRGSGEAPGGQGTSDQIRELARLRDEGHISSAEFEAKKRELLERM